MISPPSKVYSFRNEKKFRSLQQVLCNKPNFATFNGIKFFFSCIIVLNVFHAFLLLFTSFWCMNRYENDVLQKSCFIWTVLYRNIIQRNNIYSCKKQFFQSNYCKCNLNDLKQKCQTQFLEGHSPAEFSSSPDSTHLSVGNKQA